MDNQTLLLAMLEIASSAASPEEAQAAIRGLLDQGEETPEEEDEEEYAEKKSGRFTDRRGHPYCLEHGKRTACHTGEHATDVHATQAREHVARLVGNPASVTPADIQSAADALKRMTRREVEALKKEHGLHYGPAARRKAEHVKKLIEEAGRIVKRKEAWSRKARSQSIDPEEMFATANGMRQVAMEYRTALAKMLQEARALYANTSGKHLTRNHPAFRGGDMSLLRGFDTTARTMAGRYPELLGAHGYGAEQEEESASEKLFELLTLGTPPPPRVEESYQEALDYLSSRRRPAEREPWD